MDEIMAAMEEMLKQEMEKKTRHRKQRKNTIVKCIQRAKWDKSMMGGSPLPLGRYASSHGFAKPNRDCGKVYYKRLRENIREKIANHEFLMDYYDESSIPVPEAENKYTDTDYIKEVLTTPFFVNDHKNEECTIKYEGGGTYKIIINEVLLLTLEYVRAKNEGRHGTLCMQNMVLHF